MKEKQEASDKTKQLQYAFHFWYWLNFKQSVTSIKLQEKDQSLTVNVISLPLSMKETKYAYREAINVALHSIDSLYMRENDSESTTKTSDRMKSYPKEWTRITCTFYRVEKRKKHSIHWKPSTIYLKHIKRNYNAINIAADLKYQKFEVINASLK